jgi:hypothetical protein
MDEIPRASEEELVSGGQRGKKIGYKPFPFLGNQGGYFKVEAG